MNDLNILYLNLVKKSLTCELYEGMDGSVWSPGGFWQRLLLKMCVPSEVRLLRPVNPEARNEGRDWPYMAQTMVGSKRLDNLQFCVEGILADRVSGDLIETGVWRGGSAIFMRAILKAHEVSDRCVWVADSFQGLPQPDAGKYPMDVGDSHHQFENLAVSLEQVRANFQRYGLLDDQVRFLKGWFKDTLPSAPIEKLAIIRLDGDMYESTMDGLINLYPKLSPGGFLIVDDYGAIPACKKAVHDYREQHHIREEIHPIDWTGVYWRRSAAS
ncbi:MAG: TylF/MycF family methyltransferase [Verrucomicrobiia bacterium]